MKVELVYLHVAGYSGPGSRGPGFFDQYHRRFADTYRKFSAGYEHRLRVIFCSGFGTDNQRAIYSGIEHLAFGEYDGTGWDIGALRKSPGA
jgi:hypothetical protein